MLAIFVLNVLQENDDEPLPPDELPDYMKPPKESPPINIENVITN